MRLLLSLGLFQRDELGLGQDQAFLGALGLQCFEPLVHRSRGHDAATRTHAGGRDREPALAQFVGDADLTEGRLSTASATTASSISCATQFFLRLLAADLFQRQLAAFVIEFLKAVEAVAAIAHHLAGLADIAELLGELQEPNLGADDLLFGRHVVSSIRRGGALRHPDRSAPRLGLQFAVGSGHHMSD